MHNKERESGSLRRRVGVRELTGFRRSWHSLSAKVVRTTLVGALLVLIITMAFIAVFYVIPVASEYMKKASDVAEEVGKVYDNIEGMDTLCEDVQKIYYGMSEEERKDPDSEEYKARFRKIADSEIVREVILLLQSYRNASHMQYVYIGFIDRENNVLVYVADPDYLERGTYSTGYWEPIDKDEAALFLNGPKEADGLMASLSYEMDYGIMCTGGYQLKNKDGELYGFVMTDITLRHVYKNIRWYFVMMMFLMAFLLLFMMVLVNYRMQRIVIMPLARIMRSTKEYSEDKQENRGITDHYTGLRIHSKDEIEELSLILSEMEQDMVEYEKNLTKATAERERISTELDLATRIQTDMLPSTFPPYPDRHEFDIYASMDPAREVGGDFYDFFLVDEDHLVLVMADVSGKGIPAALIMMMSKIIINNKMKVGLSPAVNLMETNDIICDNNEDMFVTVWLGVLEISTGRITACNAGHEKPVIIDADGRARLINDRHDFVIGGMEGMKYNEYGLELKPGEKLFLYTDGVPEATSAETELFGTDRMVDALSEAGKGTPKEIIEAVTGAVDAFVKEAEQFDDMTMLCVEYKGKE